MTALEIVKAYYNAFNIKNYEGMLALIDEEIHHEPNQGQPRSGKGLFALFLEDMDRSYDELLSNFTYFISEDEQKIAVRFTVQGIYKVGDEPPAFGQKYELPAAAFLEVRNGLICQVTTYYNLPHWIKLVS